MRQITNHQPRCYFTINISITRQEVVFNMDVLALNKMLLILENIKSNSSIITDISDILSIEEKDLTTPVTCVVIKTDQTDGTDSFVINYCIKTNKLSFFLNDFGIHKLKKAFLFLKDRLKLGIEDDINYMIQDWGGTGLLKKKVIDDSIIICMMRIYSLVDKEE